MSRYTRTNNFPAGQKARGAEVKAEFDAVQQWATDMPDSDDVWSGNVNYAAAAGTANAITLAAPDTWTTYTGKDGYRLSAKIAADNTGAVTLNVDGLGTKAVVRTDGAVLQAGDLKVNGVYDLVYNESQEKFYVTAYNGIAVAAAASATAAASSASAAATSETNAGNSATAAAGSASSASTSASTATTKASEASSSAASAASSAAAASTSEANAAGSASAAGTSATNAAASAAAASTSESNAASSAGAASSSASSAAASAAAASTSETNAAASASAAASSATTAATEVAKVENLTAVANGVIYANGSGALTSGSGLQFDPSGNLGVNVTPVQLGASITTLHMRGRDTNNTGGIKLDASDGGYMAYMYAGNGGMYLGNSGNIPLRVLLNGTEHLHLAPSGNLGLGVTPSGWRSGWKAIQVGSASSFASGTAGQPIIAHNAYQNTSNQWIYLSSTFASNYEQANGTHYWYTAPSGTAGAAITFTQAMTLDASGKLLIGATSDSVFGARLYSENTANCAAFKATGTAAGQAVDIWHAATSGDNVFQRFWTEGTVTQRGSITYNRGGGLVAYNTTSDYRAKDIFGLYETSGDAIDALQVHLGKMKGSTLTRPMFIAHEVQAVLPYAVTGTKDASNDDGTPKYQQMDHSSLIPLLTAEVKQLRKRIAVLEAA